MYYIDTDNEHKQTADRQGGMKMELEKSLLSILKKEDEQVKAIQDAVYRVNLWEREEGKIHSIVSELGKCCESAKEDIERYRNYQREEQEKIESIKKELSETREEIKQYFAELFKNAE